MRNIILIGLILFSINVCGQVHSIGIQGGVNLSNCTSKIEFGDRAFKTGILSGFNYEYLYKSKYTLGADLLYSQLGFKNEVKFYDFQKNAYRSSDLKFSYDYLSLPVKIGYTRGNHLKGFVKVGVCPSVLIDAKIRIHKDDPNIVLMGEETDLQHKVPKFDFGGLIEFGAAYELKNDLELFSSFTYRKSFTTISTVEHFRGAQMRHYLFSMEIGLKYKLNAS
ncbi:MAG TPA: hypothetical protein DCL77_00110 [Prolixibacteraceae bacterium]|jgi:opacity protein-like surface antigen|nr:hypothetical protein [Prolixibacteraceae bacterium]